MKEKPTDVTSGMPAALVKKYPPMPDAPFGKLLQAPAVSPEQVRLQYKCSYLV